MTDIPTIESPGTAEVPDEEWVAGLRPSVAVELVTERLADLDDTWWAMKSPGELLATMRSLQQLRSVLDGVELQVVAEIDATSAAKHEGWASTRDYVTAVTGGRKGTGRRLVALAHALATDRTATAAALGQGRICRDQAEVIVAAVDQLPVAPGLREAAERVLIEEARDCDASELARSGRYVATRLDPAGEDRRDERALAREERAAHLSRFLSISEDGIGGVRVKGRGTVEDAAWLRSVLLPLAAPLPAGDRGACGGQPTTATTPGDRRGACGVEDCAHDGGDPRDHGARMWDALVDAARLLATTDLLPESHGARPRLTVTLSLQALTDALTNAPANTPPGTAGGTVGGAAGGTAGGVLVESGGTLSAATARRLACDADLVPAVLGSRSQVLDVGRTSRLVTPGQWVALVARYQHCAFPGCTRPPLACDAHHITHWADGGSTSLDNLVLLCRAHHTLLHTTPWRVRLAPEDQRPEFHPPPTPGATSPPDTGWIRRRPLRE